MLAGATSRPNIMALSETYRTPAEHVYLECLLKNRIKSVLVEILQSVESPQG